ncbi:conserved hypothetical membrane protein [Mycobacterium ulcerans Agy99]|uniref:Conserved hypothetical membrane protein n=1 Tax=Mycobacterium ulcerans (strain Agy99) TaxID=362242 RepID=A0PTL5_MYCUA|nr:conserved hypothetical membrane protein [Mycobacterium ulcerans Agy99]
MLPGCLHPDVFCDPHLRARHPRAPRRWPVAQVVAAPQCGPRVGACPPCDIRGGAGDDLGADLGDAGCQRTRARTQRGGNFFGIGAALVLDEYALILHLSDVYWEEDGRTSVDAVFAAVAVAGLLTLGLHPLMFFPTIWSGSDSVLPRAVVVGGLVLTLPLATVVLIKGKVWTGLLGMFIVVLLVIGAIRLSRPHAPWAPVALYRETGQDAASVAARAHLAPPGGAGQALVAVCDRRHPSAARRARRRGAVGSRRSPRAATRGHRADIDLRIGCGDAVLL